MEVSKKKSRLTSPSSAEIIAGNDDLLEQILVVLPAKSLVKFKSVSKHWKFLISDRSFHCRHRLNHHRRRHESPSFILGVRGRASQFLICHPTAKKLSRFPLNFDFLYYRNVKILQSCNGLLLIKTKTYDGSRTAYYIINPVTKMFRCITPDKFLPLAVCLLFNVTESNYRVVAFWKEKVDHRVIDHFSVYSSASLSWKDGREFPGVVSSGWDGVSWNDRAYFIRTTLSSSMYYSPKQEKLLVIPSPPKGKGRKYIVESNRHLHCLYISFNGNTPCFDISELIGNKWLSTKTVGTYTIGNAYLAELLGMIRAERIEDSMFLFHVPGRIMMYRFGEACEVLVDYRRDFFYEEGQFQFEFKDAHLFTGSFASV